MKEEEKKTHEPQVTVSKSREKKKPAQWSDTFIMRRSLLCEPGLRGARLARQDAAARARGQGTRAGDRDRDSPARCHRARGRGQPRHTEPSPLRVTGPGDSPDSRTCSPQSQGTTPGRADTRPPGMHQNNNNK